MQGPTVALERRELHPDADGKVGLNLGQSFLDFAKLHVEVCTLSQNSG